MLAALALADRATVTNMICTHAGQHRDWSAAYRLYSMDRVDHGVLFDAALKGVLAALPGGEPLVVAMDDTIIRKCGTHIDGVSWRRDPLGPHFQTNLVRAQRFLQMSAAWPLEGGQARMIPVVFDHTPSAKKPARDASPEDVSEYREKARQMCLNTQAIKEMEAVRKKCPAERVVIFCGDGSYTNTAVIKNLPAQSTYIGRIRKDAKLYEIPVAQPAKASGRPRCYGPEVETPEKLRTDDSIPWQSVRAFAAGKQHDFRVKTLGPVRWRKSGTEQALRVVVIAPLGYRLRKGGKLLYRAPAFLICTDPALPLEKLVQSYLWRWGIEVNFREEKTLVGAGDAQVRTPASNRHLPAVLVASYAFLCLAALRMHKARTLPQTMARPKWRKGHESGESLPSCGDLLRTLRAEIWSRALSPSSLSDFAHMSLVNAKSQKPSPSLPSMLFCAA